MSTAMRLHPKAATVMFELLADSERTGKPVVLDGKVDQTGEATAWKAEWKNLPKYKIVNGEAVEIVYTVKEITPWPGYTIVADGRNDYEQTGKDLCERNEGLGECQTERPTAPDGATVMFEL